MENIFGQSDNDHRALADSRRLREAGDTVRAAAVLEEALAGSTAKNDLYRELGEIYALRGDFGRALDRLAKALEFCPGDTWALFKLGLVYKATGAYDKARSVFLRLAQAGATAAAAHKELGELLYRQGDPAGAAEHLERALSLDPGNAAASFFLGLVCRSRGALDRALELFTGAMKGGFDVEECGQERTATWHMLFTAEARKSMASTGPLQGLPAPADASGSAEDLAARGLTAVRRGNIAEGLALFRSALEAGLEYDDPCRRNKTLTELEIAAGATVLATKPTQLFVMLTNRCTMRCRMCLTWKQEVWDLPEKTIDEIIGLYPYLERVVWMGGEVFFCPHFRRLLESGGRYPRLRQLVTTSGMPIDDAWADTLTRLNVDITFSIDSLDKKKYEAIRKNASFDKLLRAVSLVKKYRKANNSASALSINFVVMRDNYQEMGAMYDFAREQGFGALTFNLREGRTAAGDVLTGADHERLKAICSDLAARSGSEGVDVTVQFNPGRPEMFIKEVVGDVPAAEVRPGPEGGRKTPCSFPWQHMIVDLDMISVQCFCRRKDADFSAKSLQELWNDPFMQSYRKKLLLGDRSWCDPKCPFFKQP